MTTSKQLQASLQAMLAGFRYDKGDGDSALTVLTVEPTDPFSIESLLLSLPGHRGFARLASGAHSDPLSKVTPLLDELSDCEVFSAGFDHQDERGHVIVGRCDDAWIALAPQLDVEGETYLPVPYASFPSTAIPPRVEAVRAALERATHALRVHYTSKVHTPAWRVVASVDRHAVVDRVMAAAKILRRREWKGFCADSLGTSAKSSTTQWSVLKHVDDLLDAAATTKELWVWGYGGCFDFFHCYRLADAAVVALHAELDWT